MYFVNIYNKIIKFLRKNICATDYKYFIGEICSVKKIVVLSCDPGLVNHSFCVCEYTKGRRKLLTCGMFKYTVRSLVKGELETQVRQYSKQLIKLIKQYKPTHFVAERFQVRGIRQQSIVECVSLMLGICARICQKHNIDYTFPIAATWKTHFQKTYKSLDVIYEAGAERKIPPHVIDGCLMGWYIAQKMGYYSYQYLYKDQSKWLDTMKKLMV